MNPAPETQAPFKDLWSLLKPVKPTNSQMAILITLTLVATAFEIALPLYARYIVDQISIDTVSALTAITLGGFIIVMAFIQFLTAWFGGSMGHQIAKKLRLNLVNSVLKAKPQSIEKEHSAELSARINNDSKILKTVLSEDLVNLLGGIVSIVAVIAMLFILDWRLSLIILGCVLFGAILITPITIAMQGIGEKLQATEARLVQQNTEWFKNIKTIKASQAERQIEHLAEDILEENVRVGMRETTLNAIIGPVANLVLMTSLIALLASAGFFISAGTLTLGTLTAFILYLFGLTFPLISLGMFFSNLNKAAGSAIRLKDIDQLPQENKQLDLSQSVTINEGVTSIELQNLCVDVIDEETKQPRPILNSVSHLFPNLGLHFLSGDSGAGKSTLLQTLLGFYNVKSGAIKLNGEEIQHDNLRQLRAHIAWVEQEPQLLHGTVRENLMLGNVLDITDEEIYSVLKTAQLQSWLEQINYNLEQPINEQQAGLSGGEKQRFAIARAILTQKQILFLDEPTSALDKNNETNIMNLIRKLGEEKLIFMITHNPNLVHSSDSIMKL